jgi:hypothetical protein
MSGQGSHSVGIGRPAQGQTYWTQLGDLIGAPATGARPGPAVTQHRDAEAGVASAGSPTPGAAPADLGAFTDRDPIIRARPLTGPDVVRAFLDHDARLVPEASLPVYVVEPELGSISPGTARVTRSALRPILAPGDDDPVGYAVEVRVVTVFGHAHPATLHTTKIAERLDGTRGPTVFVEDRLSRDSRPVRVTRRWGSQVTVLAPGLEPEELDERIERALRAEFVSGVHVSGSSGGPVAAHYVTDTVERESARVKVVQVGQVPDQQHRVATI